VEQYRTEEEQVEALSKWWDENGRSIIAAIIIALSVGFGWQGWKDYGQGQREEASDIYQAMLQKMASEQSAEKPAKAITLAEQLKTDYSRSTYAQFAALHLARLAVDRQDLNEAQAQLRWVLGKADKGSDTAQVAQLRLARVLASAGDAEQALAILGQGGVGTYRASYAVARGDILLALGREDEARMAYSAAQAAGDLNRSNMATLGQKLQSLNPVPAREIDRASDQESGVNTADEEPTGVASDATDQEG
jgi:predicted negative regulator of RcsB-dependent stress response